MACSVSSAAIYFWDQRFQNGHAADTRENETSIAAPAKPHRVMPAPSKLGDDGRENPWVTVASPSAGASQVPVIGGDQDRSIPSWAPSDPNAVGDFAENGFNAP